jgi:hypothetical protein
MIKHTLTYSFVFCFSAVLASFEGCDQRFNLSSLPSAVSGGAIGDTVYVEKGIWTGFNRPRAIMVGQDQLLYVADTYNNRVVMLNQAGQRLSESKPILHPISFAQDLHLDLLVGAELIEPTTNDTIGVILRIKLVAANHNLSQARIDTIWKEPARPKRRFVGIGIMKGDEFLVARDGPDNTSVVDPDARVLRFKHVKLDSVTYADRFVTPLSELQTGQGSSITSVNHPTGIATFSKSADFILTQQSDGIQYSAIWMLYTKNSDFEGWLPKYDPTQVVGVDFIVPNRFRKALGVGIDVSKSVPDIFIVDAMQDSVVKFNSRGKFKSESFGARSPGITLKHPGGVAVAENTLYVCDTENDRIVLYRLSTGN